MKQNPAVAAGIFVLKWEKGGVPAGLTRKSNPEIRRPALKFIMKIWMFLQVPDPVFQVDIYN
jgi:hypothetical protein